MALLNFINNNKVYLTNIHLGVKQEINEYENKEEEMGPPSTNKTNNLKGRPKNNKISGIKGSIVNISSPFKENVCKDNSTNSPFWKSFLSPFCSKYIYQGSPLLKNELTPSYHASQYPNHLMTPGSNYGMQDQGVEDNMITSPFLGFKNKLDYDTPVKKDINQT